MSSLTIPVRARGAVAVLGGLALSTLAFARPLAAVPLAVPPLVIDEGMWTFDNPPRQQLKDKYGFEPDQAWLDHVRLSSVRFNSGGSGSFVSRDGLVMTNHHVGSDVLEKLR